MKSISNQSKTEKLVLFIFNKLVPMLILVCAVITAITHMAHCEVLGSIVYGSISFAMARAFDTFGFCEDADEDTK